MSAPASAVIGSRSAISLSFERRKGPKLQFYCLDERTSTIDRITTGLLGSLCRAPGPAMRSSGRHERQMGREAARRKGRVAVSVSESVRRFPVGGHEPGVGFVESLPRLLGRGEDERGW